jgi:hypothetical protein
MNGYFHLNFKSKYQCKPLVACIHAFSVPESTENPVRIGVKVAQSAML